MTFLNNTPTLFDAVPEKKDSWSSEWGSLEASKYRCALQGTILRGAARAAWMFSDSSGNGVGNWPHPHYAQILERRLFGFIPI